MTIEILPCPLTVSKLNDMTGVDFDSLPCFLCRTDAEISLVCPTSSVPANTTTREDGWKAFRVQGQLDFGLVGILAAIAGALAERSIPIFAVSTFDTDYVLVKEDRLSEATEALRVKGYEII